MRSSLLFLMFMAVSVAAGAEPTISGVSGAAVDGRDITVTGSAFGAGPHLILFDDFSGASRDATAPTAAAIGNWASSKCMGFEDPLLSNGRAVRCIGAGQLSNIVTFPDTTEVFMSSVVYVPAGRMFPSASALQTFPSVSALKHFWLMYGAMGYKDATLPDTVGVTWTGAKFYTLASNDVGISTYDQNGSIGWMWGAPIRLSFWLKANGSVSGSGFFQGVSQGAGQVTRAFAKPFFTDAHIIKAWNQLNIIGYARSDASFDGGQAWVVDDVYLATGDNAAARIEVGNAPTYAASTKIALLTPKQWEDGQIVATFREGTFRNLEPVQAYLYVSDANGTYNSNGYPINLTSTSTGSAPAAPAALTVE